MRQSSLIEEITNRIIKHIDPDRIILFGSYGGVDQDQSSDIDLLIVKETDKRPHDRRVEVEKLLSDRACPVDVLVYTPKEIRMLFAMGSPFIQEIMEKGRLLYMRKATFSWMQDAKEELDAARILLDHGKYRGACYHSQQCVEKGLKALILERGERPERSHDIIQLLNRVKELDWQVDLDLDEAIFLNSIYKGRYPTEEGLLPHGEPSNDEASEAVRSADKLMIYLGKAV